LCFSQITSYELVDSWSIFEIENIYAANMLPSYSAEINYEVDGYKVLYNTINEQGASVTASGAIFLPVDSDCSLPILSWQHGTVVANSGAPSQKIDEALIGIASASHGYIVIMSDYLGLGEGDGFHNYCHAETESSAIIDLILAATEFSNQ